MTEQRLDETQAGRQIPGSAPLPYLRGWRVKRGYSVRELGERADVSKTTIMDLEQHQKRAFATTITKLAKALGIRWWILLDVNADDVEDRRGAA